MGQTKLAQHSLKGRNVLTDRTPNPPSVALVPSVVYPRRNNSEYKIGYVGNALGKKNTKKTNIWAACFKVKQKLRHQ